VAQPQLPPATRADPHKSDGEGPHHWRDLTHLSQLANSPHYASIGGGLLLIAAIAITARLVSTRFALLPDVALALLFGLAIRNIVLRRQQAATRFTVHYLLRLAIILLGSSLSLGEVLGRGSHTLELIVALIVVAMALGFGLAHIFRLSNAVGTLIGAGTAICGASAILVISPLVKARSEETAYALTTIFAFNLIALLVYPWIGHQLNMSEGAFGIWDGTAVNDTSVVVATGYVFGVTAGAAATVVKLTRTALLLPVAVIVGMVQANGSNQNWTASLSRAIPWFVLGFLAMSIARTLGAIPIPWLSPMAQGASWLIVCVLAAVGLNTDIRSMVQLGPRPLVVGILLAATMGALSLAAVEGLRLS
jgi:uncharacterized integral membrane protein (TIGR00698 family)